MKFLILLFLSLNAFANNKQIMRDALAELKASGIEQKAIQKGVKAPSFLIAGKNISEYYKEKPVILKFYRGSWCPYCLKELKAYNKEIKTLRAKGYQVLFLTPDTDKEIKKLIKKNSLDLRIYSDKENKIAKKFGLAFKLSDELVKVYKGFGIDLNSAQDNENNELPMPGTYVINKEGKITYAFIDADYKKRIYPQELLKHL